MIEIVFSRYTVEPENSQQTEPEHDTVRTRNFFGTAKQSKLCVQNRRL
jgi:hypothetical protein